MTETIVAPGAEHIDHNSLDPIPELIDLQSGLSMWTIKGYRIWANNYPSALDHLKMIESF